MISNIKSNAKWTLYYMGKAAKAIQEGEDPTFWLTAATRNGALLGKYMFLNDCTNAEKEIDYKQIYQDAMDEAKKELAKDE